ncbi:MULTISPECIES: hypothetical protein [unclassified Bosea (in: a-proteobacteria)]|jgi:putative intracellular protease/amidase|uniref:hypothetical protein n=1 Tax=unclassified Bosea (in: a-proteobacteria) TaxID=2653178 RepID=UPI000F757A95|nr:MULTISPECIES: hypothetical protein [unclassified Bosea (in: a-proteobacteria)]AZO82172.1 hypothetical protein BLM15_30830 [Bosea sp. Tri-49]RXT20740.1 hypothetical protein B5U98_18315 [Bosea sp. Tri-39]RXT33712.1 hypothetical protein B5U99_18140 [Bosea sp. Tri-54]
MRPQRVVLIIGSADGSETAERSVFVEVYFGLRDKGIEVVIASAQGGHAWTSRPTRNEIETLPLLDRFWSDQTARDDVSNTLRLDEIFVQDFDGGFCIGIPGALWQTDTNTPAATLIAQFMNAAKAVVILTDQIDIAPDGAGHGLLILGGRDWPPEAAVLALLAAIRPRQTREGDVP